MGANHNFFNTEWTPARPRRPSFDDWGGDRDAALRPGHRRPAQRPPSSAPSGRPTSRAPCTSFAGDDESLPLFDGSHATVPSVGGAEVLQPRHRRRPRAAQARRRRRRCRSPQRRRDQVLHRRVATLRRRVVRRCGRGAGRGRGRPALDRRAATRPPTRRWFEMALDQAGGRRRDAARRAARPAAPTGSSCARSSTAARGDVQLDVRLTDALRRTRRRSRPSRHGKLPGAAGTAAEVRQALGAGAAGRPRLAAAGIDLTRITRVDLVAKSAKRPGLGRRPGSGAGRAARRARPRRTPLLNVSRRPGRRGRPRRHGDRSAAVHGLAVTCLRGPPASPW